MHKTLKLPTKRYISKASQKFPDFYPPAETHVHALPPENLKHTSGVLRRPKCTLCTHSLCRVPFLNHVKQNKE